MRNDDAGVPLYSTDYFRASLISGHTKIERPKFGWAPSPYITNSVYYWVTRDVMFDMVRKEIFNRLAAPILSVQPTDCMLADAGFALGFDIKNVLDEMSQRRMKRKGEFFFP